MLRPVLALALVLAGCYNPWGDPNWPEIRDIEVAGTYKQYNQDKAMLLAEAMIEDEFGLKFDNVWENTTVYWAHTRCPHSDSYAVVYKGECYYGIMWSCREMYVALSNKDPAYTCGSALLHEFGHCLHIEAFGHGDHGHEHEDWWQVIGEAAAQSCERNW